MSGWFDAQRDGLCSEKPFQTHFSPAYWAVPRFPSAVQLSKIIRPRRRAAASYFHGWRHWRAVAAIGSRLALRTPHADVALVNLFALLHDVERQDDGDDPEHGERSAVLVEHIGKSLGLTGCGIALLSEACRSHNLGFISNDPTVGVCWDADRLTLPRVGLKPKVEFLSTNAGKRPDLHRWCREIVQNPPRWGVAFATLKKHSENVQHRR